MRTNQIRKRLHCSFVTSIIFALTILMLSCSKTDEGPVIDTSYSGNGNFTFSGDYNEPFNGTVSNTGIQQNNGIELLPLSFVNTLGQELFIGLKSGKLEARSYTMKEIDAEGYSGFQFPNGLYDTGAKGGKGTVTISNITSKEIKGSVDMRLARPLNTADTVIVKGTFLLKAN